jgi:hypothetical protein
LPYHHLCHAIDTFQNANLFNHTPNLKIQKQLRLVKIWGGKSSYVGRFGATKNFSPLDCPQAKTSAHVM